MSRVFHSGLHAGGALHLPHEKHERPRTVPIVRCAVLYHIPSLNLIPNYSCILINGTIVYIGNLYTVICMNNLTVTHVNRYMIYHTGL